MSTAPSFQKKTLEECWQQILFLLSEKEFSFKDTYWAPFCHLVHWHRLLLDVLPTVKQQTESLDFTADQIDSLDKDSFLLRKNLLMLSHVQEQICKNLQEQGIRALFFKGAVVAEWLYGSSIARQSQDIDLIVHPDEHDLACNVLEKMQCRRVIPEAEVSPSGIKRYKRAMKDYSYLHTPSGVLIEIHWKLRPFTQAFQFDFDQAWEKHRTQLVDGHPIPTFDDSTHIRYLAAHGCLSHWGRLRWLMDWHRLSGLDLNWENIISDCQNPREKAYIKNAFLLTQHQLGTAIPDLVEKIPPCFGQGFIMNTQIKSHSHGQYPNWTKRQLLNLLNQKDMQGAFGYLGHMSKKTLAADTL